MFVFALLILATLGLVTEGCSRRTPTTALYAGKCRNVTHQVDGNVKLLIENNRSKVEGYISISGHLVGTGAISGKWKGDSLEFTSSDPIHNTTIRWQAKQKHGSLTGEYFSAPSTGSPEGQVGEWSATLQSDTKRKDASGRSIGIQEDFRRRFIFDLETSLNEPVKLNDGSIKLGAQVLFDNIHPIGQAISVTVNDIDITWRDGAKGDRFEDLYTFTVGITLFWSGPITQYGTTDLEMTYNSELGTYTKQTIKRSDGITNQDASDIAFGIGRLIGEVAVQALLGD